VRRNKWPLLVAALFALLAFTAAGCGGDDEGEEGGTAGQTGEQQPAAEQVITIAWGAEPPSLDPGLASDTTSANIIGNIMDPLLRIDHETSEPIPGLAESWEVSEDGLTVTINLRDDGMWTNGDPVTAEDYVYSWKRTLSPELAADYAYQLYAIKGGQEYNGCEANCDALADAVGLRAVDDTTLEVTLVSPQPWFIAQLSHHSFLPVHQATVEQFGDAWTLPENIVTNGPFKLVAREPEASIDLEKWADWRNADEVSLERVNGRIIIDGTTRVQAFEAGEVDALDGSGLPPDEMSRLKELPEYENYPYLGTYYYGFNVENISDVNQRKAMSLAIDRQTIIDNIAQADQQPATGMTPPGIAGQEEINPNSPWTPASGDIEQAKTLLEQVSSPDTQINLFHNDAPGHREIAVAVQSMWQELGMETAIKAQEWAQYLEFIGPPPSKQVDVFRLGWIYDFPDAWNGLSLWTCESGNNSTNFCNEEFDALVKQAENTPDDAERFQIYAQAEQIMFGEDGEVPIAPIYWYTLPNLENLSIKDTLFIGPFNDMDLTKVVVTEAAA
jgi:oligopeptide transport system substrate-binding protein